MADRVSKASVRARRSNGSLRSAVRRAWWRWHPCLNMESWAGCGQLGRVGTVGQSWARFAKSNLKSPASPAPGVGQSRATRPPASKQKAQVRAIHESVASQVRSAHQAGTPGAEQDSKISAVDRGVT